MAVLVCAHLAAIGILYRALIWNWWAKLLFILLFSRYRSRHRRGADYWLLPRTATLYKFRLGLNAAHPQRSERTPDRPVNAFLSETTVTVLGKKVTDPLLQLVGGIAIVPIFLGMTALVLSQRMVDEERIRAEPRVSKFVGGGLVPRRILTDMGRKVRVAAYVSLAIGGLLLFFTILKTQ